MILSPPAPRPAIPPSCNTCGCCSWRCIGPHADQGIGNCTPCKADGIPPDPPSGRPCSGLDNNCSPFWMRGSFWCCCDGLYCTNDGVCKPTTAPFTEGGRPCNDYPPPCSFCVAPTNAPQSAREQDIYKCIRNEETCKNVVWPDGHGGSKMYPGTWEEMSVERSQLCKMDELIHRGTVNNAPN